MIFKCSRAENSVTYCGSSVIFVNRERERIFHRLFKRIQTLQTYMTLIFNIFLDLLLSISLLSLLGAVKREISLLYYALHCFISFFIIHRLIHIFPTPQGYLSTYIHKILDFFCPFLSLRLVQRETYVVA